MVIGGNSHASVVTHTATAAASKTNVVAARSETVSRSEIEATPTYFRSISSISYGSLAGAYSAIKAIDAQTSSVDVRNATQPAILSGVGIPSAMQAYEDVIATSGH